jgi:hypothetical protein
MKGSAYDFPPARVLRDLIDILSERSQASPTLRRPKTRYSGRTKEDGPLIILAFDEAHTLAERRTTEFTQWSSFSELQHALRALHRFSLFSLFMSTTGEISQFTSARTEDVSSRILTGKLALIQPFTDLGFDTLARNISLSQAPDLQKLMTNDHIAHLGRPLCVWSTSLILMCLILAIRFGSLYDVGDQAVQEDIISFAAMKLLNAEPTAVQEFTDDQKLACLSQRIPLEFNSTTYVAQVNERKQVEGHMRVCLKIDATFESMVTVSASEPLLSEAAYTIMAKTSFDVPKAMKSVLEGFAIHKGDRGEFLIMLLFTIARDNAVGPPDQDGLPTQSRVVDVAPFLTQKLFRHRNLELLHTDFPEAKMHFNHYVKVHEHAAIDAESLLLLSGRGGGILCANSQYAIDGINPFLCHGMTLALGNLGLILWQGKNDPAFTDDPQQALFEAMNVYKLKILKKGDAAIPLIKIVFALAAETPSLKVVRHSPSSEYNAIVYDIWCAGISPDTLSAVEPLQVDTWAALLQASYGWKSIYKGQDVDKTLRRSMNPGAATDIDHWAYWAERSDRCPRL